VKTTPTNKDATAKCQDEGSKGGGGGAAHREYRYSSWRVGELMFTINSHYFEILVARCVEEMVCNTNSKTSFFSFTFFIMCLVLINYWE